MPQSLALVDDDVRRHMTALSADLQAAMALNRAALSAVVAISPAILSAANEALEIEADQARVQAAPQCVVDAIETVRTRFTDPTGEDPRLAALERALIAAADALPDFDLDAAEARLSGH